MPSNDSIQAGAFDLPITFTPIYKEKIWGGDKLRNIFHRMDADPSLKIGESWEISARDDNDSVVNAGPLLGKTLNELWKNYPKQLLGVDTAPSRFPLLVKLIDAADDLSVQVHPADAYAVANEDDLGKAECWVILNAQAGSKIQRGLIPGTTKQAFSTAVSENRIMDLLHFIPAEPGMVLAQPSGCVHAIGKGVVLAEIQQNSDVTYRVYDYDRPGLDGKLRPIHVAKALDVIGFDSLGAEFDGDMVSDTVSPEPLIQVEGLRAQKLASGSKFHMAMVELQAGETIRWQRGMSLADKNVFEVWMVLEGNVMVRSAGASIELSAVTSALVPAAAQELTVQADRPTKILWAAPEEFTYH